MNNKLTRRQLASTGLAMTATSAVGLAGTTVQKLMFEAPEDVYVTRVVAADGVVQKGQVLFILTSYRLLETANRLAFFQENLEIAERPFNDGRVASEIKLLKDKAENFKQVCDILKKRLEKIAYQRQAGLRSDSIDDYQPYWQVDNQPATTTSRTTENGSSATIPNQSNQYANETRSISNSDTTSTSLSKSFIANPLFLNPEDVQISLAKATNDYDEAAVVASHAETSAKETLERLQAARTSLSRHHQLISEQTAALTVVSAVAGHFTSAVTSGLAVKKGHELGSLTT